MSTQNIDLNDEKFLKTNETDGLSYDLIMLLFEERSSELPPPCFKPLIEDTKLKPVTLICEKWCGQFDREAALKKSINSQGTCRGRHTGHAQKHKEFLGLS